MKQQIAKGDRVKIDVELRDSDLSQRITKVTKIHKDELIEPPSSFDVFGPKPDRRGG